MEFKKEVFARMPAELRKTLADKNAKDLALLESSLDHEYAHAQDALASTIMSQCIGIPEADAFLKSLEDCLCVASDDLGAHAEKVRQMQDIVVCSIVSLARIGYKETNIRLLRNSGAAITEAIEEAAAK